MTRRPSGLGSEAGALRIDRNPGPERNCRHLRKPGRRGFKVAINDTNVEYFFSNCSPKEAHHDLRIVGTFNVTGGSVTTGGLSVGGGSEGQFEAVEYPVTVTGERLPSVGKAVVLKAVNLPSA